MVQGLLNGSAGKCWGDSEDAQMAESWDCWESSSGADAALDTFKDLDQVEWLELRHGDLLRKEHQS